MLYYADDFSAIGNAFPLSTAFNMSEPTKYKSPGQLLFDTPLYEPLVEMTAAQITAFMIRSFKVDGYCPECHSTTTFEKSDSLLHGAYSTTDLLSMNKLVDATLVCARHDSHRLYFNLWINEAAIQKVGQLPSFADIAMDESKAYSKLLDKEDASEFHKALGLVSHGVGIGSYVYLRRIFERLIDRRFNEFKDAKGWSEEGFHKLRMKERIDFLKDHLPQFLVDNSKIYSILSLGVHELNEKDCLAFFPVLKQSTIWILEQDKKKQEELAQQRALAQEIAKFTLPITKTPGSLAELGNVLNKTKT